MTIFEDEGDYRALFQILRQARERVDPRILTWCVMPNRWHLSWPVRKSSHRVQHVNTAQSDAEAAAIRKAIQRGRRAKDDQWRRRTAVELRLESTLVPRGRPRKPTIERNKGS